MTDHLPAQVEHWQSIETVSRNHFRKARIQEIRTPLLEVTELFSRGIGEATDVVGKEMYTFLDRSQRSCTLRPEGTASVARAIIQHGLLSKGPQRLWYAGPMFRYERPQAGRLRQFHQLGVEFIGLDSVTSEVELISVAWDLFQKLGLKGLNLEINTLGTKNDRNEYREKIFSWLEERFDKLDTDSQERLYKNPLRILDSKNPSTKDLLEDAPNLEESLCKESYERFISLQTTLEQLNIPFNVNKRLVRGLDYYSQTAFEITTDQLGAQSTICGGGRYDDLIEQLGGNRTPAIGWAIGLERLLILLKDSFLASSIPNVYIVNRGNTAEICALDITRKLRIEGLVVEIDHSQSSFNKQLKRADRSGAPWAFIIGDDEISRGEIIIKSLKLEKKDNAAFQQIVSITDIELMKSILSS